jgi:hypothetical protein
MSACSAIRCNQVRHTNTPPSVAAANIGTKANSTAAAGARSRNAHRQARNVETVERGILSRVATFSIWQYSRVMPAK